MTGHVKWTDPRWPKIPWKEINEARPGIVAKTRVWVEGYIAALEEVLMDLEVQRNEYLNDPDAQRLAEMTWGRVRESFITAHETLDQLTKIMDAQIGEDITWQ